MLHLYTQKPGSTLIIPFDSFAGATGASAAMTGLAVTDIEIYKGSSMTQRASDNGYTLLDTDGLGLDGITGINGVSIDLSDNSDAGFYVAGQQYRVVVSTVTVDSQTVSFTAAIFRIGYPGAILDTTLASLASQTSFTLTAGPADNDALNGCPFIVHDAASAVQMACGLVSDYTGSSKTITGAADPGIFTMATGDNISFFPRADMSYLSGQPATSDATLITGVIAGTPGAGSFDVTVDRDIPTSTLSKAGMQIAVFSSAGIPRGRSRIQSNTRNSATEQTIAITVDFQSAPTVGDTVRIY